MTDPLIAENQRLRQEAKQDREMIRILWQNGEFGQSCGNALSEDGVLRRALRETTHDR